MAPTGPDALTVLRLLAALGALLVIAATTADPDLWGHVRFGADILDQRAIASRDPYSFTSDRPWVNHEWLAELLMGLAYRLGGAAGLVALKTLAVVAAMVLVSTSLRRVSWRPLDHDALVGLAILATLPRTHMVRPQVFSVLLFAALLSILTRADRGDRRALILLPAVMAAWANLHGGWIVGLAMLSIWTAVRFLRRGPESIGRHRLVLLWLACVAATLINPYGVGLWTFLGETVGLSRPQINDWAPLLDLSAPLVVLAAVTAATAVAALAKARRGADPAYVLIVAALGALTLRVGRIDAFFAIAVVMLLGPYLGRARAAAAPGAAPRRPWRGRGALAAGAVAVVAGAGLLLSGAAARVTCVAVSDAPEPQSTAFLARHAPRANVLTHFDWGQYAIWHLGPRLRVSMDGRRETVYSDALVRAHVRLYDDAPGATALVARLRPDLVWLPAGLPVVASLERAGWRPAFRGRASVILARGEPRAPVRARGDTSSRRCFPQA